jgi:hypothetical protein
MLYIFHVIISDLSQSHGDAKPMPQSTHLTEVAYFPELLRFAIAV